MSAVGALLRKDLRVELRTLESIPAMAIFSVTTFVIFHFALDRSSLEGDLASGVLWVTTLFAAVLGVTRLFVGEEEQGGFDAVLLAPVDRTALFVAKALALLLFLVVLQAVALPAFALLLLEPGLGQALPAILAPLLLADVGLAVVGTLVSALAVRTRARELLVPLIGLPLLVPVVLGAAEATAPLLDAAGAGGLEARWLVVLALYDLVFALIGFAVFDFLLED